MQAECYITINYGKTEWLEVVLYMYHMKKLVSWDKDRETVYNYHHGQNRLGEN